MKSLSHEEYLKQFREYLKTPEARAERDRLAALISDESARKFLEAKNK